MVQKDVRPVFNPGGMMPATRCTDLVTWLLNSQGDDGKWRHRSPVLATFNDLIQVFFLKFREDFPRSQWKSGVKVHQQIIDSLRDGEPSIAAKHLSAHIGSHRERVTTDQ